MSDRKSRMFSAGEEPVKRTIVGGRPPARGGSTDGIPRGIEVLLRKARVDGAFRADLLAAPEDAARSIGLGLVDSERAILSAVPRETLSDMIDRIEVPEEHRSVFRGTAAAAMLSLVAASFTIGCNDPMVAPGGCVVRDDPVTEEEPKEAPEEPEVVPDKPIIIAGITIERAPKPIPEPDEPEQTEPSEDPR